MNSNKKFNNILNECLDKILQGESVEQCLKLYPDHASELEPLLRTAQTARKAAAVQPRAEFKARARYEFQSALREMKTQRSRRLSFFPWQWQWQPGWAIALIVILVIFLSGGGTVVASGSSMPDNTLYPVKLAVEKVQMAFTFSDISKAELNAEFADKRVEEVIYMASKGNYQTVQVASQRLNSNLAAMNSLVSDDSGRGNTLSFGATESNEKVLSQQSLQDNPSEIKSNELAAGAPHSTASTVLNAVPSPTGSPSPEMMPQALKDTVLSGGGIQISPVPGATGVSPQPAFQWQAVSNALSYDLQVARDPVFKDLVVSETGIIETTWTYGGFLDYGGTYYWRYRAIGDGIISQDWIAGIFTVISAPPEPVPAPATGTPVPVITVVQPPADPNAAVASGSSGLRLNQEPASAVDSSEYDGTKKDNQVKIDELERLKQTISSKALTNRILLEEALETVLPEVRPALRQTLAQAMAEYDKAIKIIERSINTLK